jgi:hypothetical protein
MNTRTILETVPIDNRLSSGWLFTFTFSQDFFIPTTHVTPKDREYAACRCGEQSAGIAFEIRGNELGGADKEHSNETGK